MPGSAWLRTAFPALICLVAVLWLVWGYLRLSVILKGALTVLSVIAALLRIDRHDRRRFPASRQAEVGIYPPANFSGPVLLVCGDISDDLFIKSACRTTARGCYLRVGPAERLSAFAGRLLARDPRMAGQLVVMCRCLPYLFHAMDMLRQVAMDELSKADRLCPAISPFVVALRVGAVRTTARAVWPQWLFRHSRLLPSMATAPHPSPWHFADPVLPLFASDFMPLQDSKTGCRVVMALMLCALAGIGLSVMHNQSLILRIGADLQRWQVIPTTDYVHKAQSLLALRRDALLLERWRRQGEPQRYGLGLYPGERLWSSVQQAIDSHAPLPRPKARSFNTPKRGAAPEIVRLDGMSLFDSGKSVLKTGSTGTLMASLAGIKARPGWLIVVAGHTDNTGSPALNQTLSMKRAEAVRDWLRDAGAIPESCFAARGHGASRPIAGNDTAKGRAANRRVEISLVPQANACQIPGNTLAPSQDDGKSHHKGERVSRNVE
ncbi:OmpA family protein [Martelella alba]|uniref:OmpA family protein n=1 Tax=Martelella alba TaxID=2590451 RepID=A0ABY2SHB1_9HYPH|nr:OmpA family protein [Martelella alba]TKI03969.1 OmpA family protein [Martelella alba]